MDIDYFVSHIREELDGAKDYIKRAIEIKPMQVEWAGSGSQAAAVTAG